MHKLKSVVLLVCSVLIWFQGNSQMIPCPPINEDCNEVDWTLDIELLYSGDVEPGVQFCVPMTVNNFISIISMEFTLTFDPTVLQFDCADAIFPGGCLANNTLSASNLVCQHNGIPSNTSGNITFLWFNVATLEGVCCNDGSVIMELCFTPIGDPGQTTSLAITDNVTPKAIEVGFDFTSSTYCNIPCNFTTTEIEIACNALNIIQTGVCTTQAGADNGSFSFYFCGGTPPYDYTVTQVPANVIDMGTTSDQGIDLVYDNLAIGTYTVSITDANGDTDFTAINIVEGTPVDFDITGQNPNCWDRDNGTATVSNITGGTPAYQFTWSNNQFGTDMIDGLGNGSYTVTVADAFGCKTEKSVSLDLDTLKVFAMVVDSASCAGANDGVVKIWAEGGVPFPGGPGDFYEFNGNAPTDTIYINDAEGGDIFLYQAEDAVTCLSVEEGIMVPFKDSFAPTQDSIRHIACHGDSTGFLRLITPNATSITVFLYDQNCVPVATGFPGQGLPVVGVLGSNTAIYEFLPAGDYKTTIRINAPPQSSGCETDFLFTILEPDTLILNTDVVQPDCVGGMGSITVSATGGEAPLTFKWNDGFVGDTRTNLPGGPYQVSVCDANMCVADTLINMNMPGSLDISIDTLSMLSCNGGANAGSLEVVINPPNPNYCIEWKDVGTNMVIGNDAIVSGLGEGEYLVLVEDKALGCQAFATATLVNNEGFSFIGATETIPDCYGSATGSVGIQVDMTMGTPPFNFNWDGFPMNNFSVLPLIPAGTYCVTVSDANNCEKDTCLILMNPDSIVLEIQGMTDALCFGGNDGSVTVEASEGSTGATIFNYFVYDDQGMEIFTSMGTVESFTNLEAGCYTVIAADLVCTSPTPLEFCIGEAPEILLDQVMITEPSCFGVCDGAINVTAMGGTGNLSFQWLNSPTAGSMLTDICAGWHYINITDQNSCTVLDSVLLTQPDTLTTGLDTTSQELSCFGDDIGEIVIDVNGGTADYIYAWENNISNTNAADSLTAGTYTVTVTDMNLCSSVFTYDLAPATDIVMQINSPQTINCFGEQTCISIDTVIGGVPPYNFTINNGPEIHIDSCFTVVAGPYLISVVDAIGCAVDTLIEITHPDELLIELDSSVIEITLGDSSTVLQANITSSLGIDSIIWEPEGLFDCITPDCQIISIFPTVPTSYTVTVVDAGGCTATNEVEVLIDDNRSVYIPNAFSPNGDGINDQFNVFLGPGTLEISDFLIFDRWGTRIFEANGIIPNETVFNGWDGSFKQRPLNPGVYAFLIKIRFVDDRVITYSGSLTLMR